MYMLGGPQIRHTIEIYVCMTKRGDILYVVEVFVPDLASVFAFPQILFLQYAQKIPLQATFLSLSQLIWTNWTSNHLLTTPPIWFFYCSQIFFENANHAKDEKVRSTSSHKFPRRIIYLSTKIKALSERYLHSCWGYLIGKITLPTNISIMMRRNRGHFWRNGDGYRGGYG